MQNIAWQWDRYVVLLSCYNYFFQTEVFAESLLVTKSINFTPLYIVTLLGHITSSVVWSFDSPYMVYNRFSIWNNSASRAVSEILSLKDFGVMTLSLWSHVTGSVTWPLDWTRNISFPIGGPLEPSFYLAWLLRYDTSNFSQAYSNWKWINPNFGFRGRE